MAVESPYVVFVHLKDYRTADLDAPPLVGLVSLPSAKNCTNADGTPCDLAPSSNENRWLM